MDTGITFLLTLLMGFMLFLIQRSERKRRRWVALGMLLGAELIRRYVWFRDVHTEAWVALAAAVVLNLLFWLLIGRYNPVGSSDRIQVIGMDD
jgi:hypothetical protein